MLFWSVRSEKATEIHPPSKEKGLWNIRHKVRMVLGTWNLFFMENSGYFFIFGPLQHFIPKCDKQYKTWLLFYYHIRQNCIAKEAELFALCSLLVTFCLLVIALCSLLIAFCLLLVNFCTLVVTFSSILCYESII